MKKRHVLCSLMAATLLSAAMTPAVAALNWKDGALANYHFQYVDGDEGIKSVNASDTNGTFNGEVKEGQTITTKTGTIAWRDSYTNVTTFTVEITPGYELLSLTGDNVTPNDYTKVDKDTYTFDFTDKGAEAWCYGHDVSFNLGTTKITYLVVDTEGQPVGSAQIGEKMELVEYPADEGQSFVGWNIAGTNEIVKRESVLTNAMIVNATEDNKIVVEPVYDIQQYPVQINKYINNRNGEVLEKTEEKKVDYGTVIDEEWLKAKGYLTEEYCLVGGKGITVGTGENVINLVKTEEAEDESFQDDYSLTYAGADEGIESVTYSIDDSDPVDIDLYETVRLHVDNAFEQKIVSFVVTVKDGYELKLDCSTGEANLEKLDEGRYKFVFTRQGDSINLPPHVSFYLSTQKVETVEEAPAGETVEAAVLVPAEEVTETVEAEVIVSAEPVAETVEEVVAE